MTISYKSEISKFPVVVKYELLKQVRRYRLHGLLILGSLITGIFVAVGLVSIPTAVGALYFSQNMTLTVVLFALVAGIFFSGDAIASEFEHKTGYVIFINPIRRTTLLLGKYVSCCLASMLVVSMPYLITSIGVVAKFGTLPAQLLLSYVFALLFVCSVVSFTFVFSALLKGSMGATIVPFLTYLFVFGIIQGLSEFVGFEPFMDLSYGSGIIGNILSDPYPTHMITETLPIVNPPLTITLYSATVAEGIAIMMSYLIIGLIISALLMKRRQMA